MSCRRRKSIRPCPVSTAMTRAAPCCKRQSVNPPVDVPTSRQTLPATSTCQCSRAASSVRPPRLTYMRSSPSRRMSAEPSTAAPAFSTFCPLTSTLPARISACARSREVVTPRSSSSLSSRTFKTSSASSAQCRKYSYQRTYQCTFPFSHRIFHRGVEKCREVWRYRNFCWSEMSPASTLGTAPQQAHHHFGDCRSPVPEVALPSYFFQKFLVDVEIRVDILHVVLIFKRFHQPDHLAGRRAFQLDVVLRNHGHARRHRLDPGFPHRFEDGFIGGRFAKHSPVVAVIAQIFGAGFEDNTHQIVFL